MKKITILLDYKGRFETKYTAIPYRSGMNLSLLAQYFAEFGYNVTFKTFTDIDIRDKNNSKSVFLYCSSEDHDSFYKSFIEDMVYGLSLAGATIIPEFKYLKAHNDKLFMEILRDLTNNDQVKNIKSLYFGTLEEVKDGNLNFPDQKMVLKPAFGSMSKGVSLVSNIRDFENNVKRISRTKDFKNEIKDIYRKIKYRGFIPDSLFRKKFILQNYIPNLDGDWKTLVFFDKYYILKRKNRINDFRASGGGRLSYEKSIPDGLLDFAKKVYQSFDTPNISLDIGFNGKDFFLFEFQFLYFGTYTIEKSDFFFQLSNNSWVLVYEKSILEKEYARSVALFLENHIND